MIADDHAVLRTGLRMLLNTQPDIQVVGEAGDAQGALAATRRARPDVVLLDLSLPDSKGPAVVETLLRACPAARVLVLTMHDDPAYVQAALAAGALGYVVKKVADVELLSAIRAVASGRTFLDATTEHATRRALGRGARGGRAPAAGLSAREHQVLVLLAHGHTNREIAQRIGVGVKTVETYRLRLGVKLGLRTRADVVDYALESGLLKPAHEG